MYEPEKDFLTEKERRAVDQVERAIAALPKTIALYFHGDTASVVRCGSDGRMLTEDGFRLAQGIKSIGTPRCAAGDY